MDTFLFIFLLIAGILSILNTIGTLRIRVRRVHPIYIDEAIADAWEQAFFYAQLSAVTGDIRIKQNENDPKIWHATKDFFEGIPNKQNTWTLKDDNNGKA